MLQPSYGALSRGAPCHSQALRAGAPCTLQAVLGQETAQGLNHLPKFLGHPGVVIPDCMVCHLCVPAVLAVSGRQGHPAEFLRAAVRCKGWQLRSGSGHVAVSGCVPPTLLKLPYFICTSCCPSPGMGTLSLLLPGCPFRLAVPLPVGCMLGPRAPCGQ